MILAVALLVGLIGSAPAVAQSGEQARIDVNVVSRNLYIGADLARAIAGEPPAALLATVQQTNFPERAQAIAVEFAASQPDLVGLQEVSQITISSQGQIIQQVDYLDILLQTLSATGQSYAVASSIDNADVTLPLDSFGTLARVLDRDVILYRTDTTTVRDSIGRNFTDNLQVSVGGFPVEFTRGYTATTATVNGSELRFVNTHLEVEGFPCATPSGLVACQNLQAAELVDALADEAEQLPTVLVGDFNAAPGDAAYEIFQSAQYLDSWWVRRNGDDVTGATCCEVELLDNATSQLDRRIDLIWIRRQKVLWVDAFVEVTGDDPSDRTPSGLWPSDHGGVAGTFKIYTHNGNW